MGSPAMLVGGYHAIALPLPNSALRRYIYVKKHATKASDGDSSRGESALAADRTVYIANLPRASTDDWLRACLEPVGAVQLIEAGPGVGDDEDESSLSAVDPLMAKTAHVVFKSKSAVSKVLSVDSLEAPELEQSSGLAGYLAKYRSNKPGLAAVKAIADKYMGDFDAKEEEDLRKREELKNQVDDDGFVTVVNTKRRSMVAAEEVLGRPAKKQKAKEVENFYRFQMREKKRDQLKSLRERFEEDKLLVEKLKKSNKFKPE